MGKDNFVKEISNIQCIKEINTNTLTQKNRTLDHMYPRRWGGVSIPDNLVPSCKNCNGDKMDMTYG